MFASFILPHSLRIVSARFKVIATKRRTVFSSQQPQGAPCGLLQILQSPEYCVIYIQIDMHTRFIHPHTMVFRAFSGAFFGALKETSVKRLDGEIIIRVT
jgi:hypothetical protein